MGGILSWLCCVPRGGPTREKLLNTVHVALDSNYLGHDCVLVKNGLRLCGQFGPVYQPQAGGWLLSSN